MSVRLSLLAILDQGPCYGYQLRTEFDRRTGSTWPVNVGQIYNTLDRLERDKLVRATDGEAENQKYFEITDAGRTEVASWLGSPVVRAGATRDELAIKVAIAVTLPGADVTAVIAAQRTSAQRALRDLGTSLVGKPAPATSEDLALALVNDSTRSALEAELRWLDSSEEAIARLDLAPVPLNTAIPRRGRPAKAAV